MSFLTAKIPPSSLNKISVAGAKESPHLANTSVETESEVLSRKLHRIFQLLYLQFAFYWATIAAGMYVNYYYSVPATVTPDIGSIISQFIASAPLFAHVSFAVLSSGMSIPVIILARRVALRQVVWLHTGAITCRLVGFVAGPLFIYYSTASINNAFSASLSTFTMASVFLMAVILSFMSRIFIVREDVRIKYVMASPNPVGVR